MFSKLLYLLAIWLTIAGAAEGQGHRLRVIFFGDSITELGVKPDGYITQLSKLIDEQGRSQKYELVGAGVSGNKIYDLYLRADNDVIAKKPDIVVIYIGVNDIWHKGLLGTGTDFDKFGKFYGALTDKFEAAKIRMVVCTPAVIGERIDFSNQFDGDLNLYSNWIRNFAAEKRLPLVDLRRSFLEYNVGSNKNNAASGILTTDKVHLNKKGNELVATEIWKVLAVLWPPE